MKSPTLHIFNCDDASDGEQIQIALEFSKENVATESAYICEEEVLVDEGSQLKIKARYVHANRSYSVSVMARGTHVFTAMGFKQSAESSDPCLLYTTKTGRNLQISLVV